MAGRLQRASNNRGVLMRKPLILKLLTATALFLTLAQAGTAAAGAHAQQARRDRRDREQRRERSEDGRGSGAPRGGRSVAVPTNVAWTNTRVQVTKGQWLRFEPSGEIRLSFNGDD